LIASFEKNFIFIKTKKTAGTSIEIVLSKYCGQRDIITPISIEDELLRMRFGAFPRNFTSSKILETIHKLALLTRIKRLATKTRIVCEKRSIFLNHMGAKEIKAKVGNDFWFHAKKVSIERHPYEKAISQAYYRLSKMKAYRNLVFHEIIDSLIDEGAYRNFDRYSIDGAVAVDYVMRFEDLNKEMKRFARLCALPRIERLPKAKSGLRTDTRSAFEILSKSQKNRIQDVCKEEFELLGYEF